jgi:hypothetical protein
MRHIVTFREKRRRNKEMEMTEHRHPIVTSVTEPAHSSDPVSHDVQPERILLISHAARGFLVASERAQLLASLTPYEQTLYAAAQRMASARPYRPMSDDQRTELEQKRAAEVRHQARTVRKALGAGKRTTLPLEREEQRRVMKWCREHGIRYSANLEGQKRDFLGQMQARASGMRRGRPDLEITSPVPGRPDIRGVFVEMKRQKPAGRPPTPEQVDEMEALRADGWAGEVHYGAESAIRWLAGLYGVRP